MKLFAAVASTVLLSSVASATDSVSVLKIRPGSTGVCPKSIQLTSVGESYAEGVKFTADIRALLELPLQIEGADAERVAFFAKVKNKWTTCKADYETKTFFNNLNKLETSIAGGELNLMLTHTTLRLDFTSSFNNQAIFGLSEEL